MVTAWSNVEKRKYLHFLWTRRAGQTMPLDAERKTDLNTEGKKFNDQETEAQETFIQES